MFYINDYGQEIKPDPNPEMLQHLAHKDVLVYACGSLWTSIVPCLALKGVASAIAKSKTLKAKVLLRELPIAGLIVKWYWNLRSLPLLSQFK